MPMRHLTLDHLIIDDESPFRAIGCYRQLKEILQASGHVFRLPPLGDGTSEKANGENGNSGGGWDRTLFLNLTYWSPTEETSVLRDEHIAADVVAHTAWHHVVMRELRLKTGAGTPSAEALFFAESIASAFDLYLVGRLLPLVATCDFLETQIPVMLEAAEEAGQSAGAFEASLREVTAEPERAFEDLRALLYDAGLALTACRSVDAAAAVLDGLRGRRFAPLLHHFQMSNWILYARAYAAPAERPALAAEVAEVAKLDAALRAAPSSLTWLEENWLARG
jgi:hypothetical protein